MDEDSIVKVVGALTEPAKLLITKVSDAIGLVYEPWHVRRIARAEADAARIEIENQIVLTDLQNRALRRWIAEETTKQSNLESIVDQALPQVATGAKPQDISNDWMLNFVDKAKYISDEEMQALWARVLAGEANSPGKYSRRTVNALSTLEKFEAHLFNALCSFAITDEAGGYFPLIYDENELIYRKQGIDMERTAHLESIGLVHHNPIGGYNVQFPSNRIDYFDHSIFIDSHTNPINTLPVGHVLLTKVGKELSALCEPLLVTGFLDYLSEVLMKQGYSFRIENLIKSD